MKIKDALLAACLSSLFTISISAAEQTVTGTVFVDLNNNQQLDPTDQRFPNAFVSNGIDIVPTDAQGNYSLPLAEKHDTVFLIKPAGYQSPLSQDFIPQFYYVNRPVGSPKHLEFRGHKPSDLTGKPLNFPLYKQNESPNYTALLFGDTQVPDYRATTWMRHDTIEPLIDNTNASFGVTLGDVVSNNLAAFEQYKTSIAQLQIPWYNVPGNHDVNFDVPDDALSMETWLRHFGPPTYSFNWANTHYIVIDNIKYLGEETKKYRGELSKDQLTFIKNDLKNVSKNTLVIPLMHIPLTNMTKKSRLALLSLIKDYPHTFSASAHRHFQEHDFYDSSNGWAGAASPEHHHLIASTICGAWWGGVRDEFGLPSAAQRDGSPNAYNILSVTDNTYTLRLRNIRRPESDQMSIYLADSIPLDQLKDQTAYINIYGGSSKSTTIARIRHYTDWLPTKPIKHIDPYHRDRLQRYKDGHFPGDGPISLETKTDHHAAFKIPSNLMPGTYLLQIKTTDMFGQTDIASRTFNITPIGTKLISPSTR
ncbi:calcineurin-like phosphoesterase C-terminal domain-containing protein [Poriferisphaera sp. WC338]|uniref:calcineurin-like phosphoesterase C-terminal domain-containing protein n=1 Tax=Poriferisphaera sp. WC338 TaxID=3425129 RepID=UPI003D817B8F